MTFMIEALFYDTEMIEHFLECGADPQLEFDHGDGVKRSAVDVITAMVMQAELGNPDPIFSNLQTLNAIVDTFRRCDRAFVPTESDKQILFRLAANGALIFPPRSQQQANHMMEAIYRRNAGCKLKLMRSPQ